MWNWQTGLGPFLWVSGLPLRQRKHPKEDLVAELSMRVGWIRTLGEMGLLPPSGDVAECPGIFGQRPPPSQEWDVGDRVPAQAGGPPPPPGCGVVSHVLKFILAPTYVPLTQGVDAQHRETQQFIVTQMTQSQIVILE